MSEENEITKRIQKWFDGGKAPPFTLEIWPTFDCNLNCIYCWRQTNIKVENKISGEKYFELINQAKELRVKRIEIDGGGEPMMFPKIIKLIKEIKENGMIGTMTTNGTLFTKNIIRKFVLEGWDLIAISLDAPDASTQDYLRGRKGCFRRILNTLKWFKFWKKRFGSEKPKIIFVPVLTIFNYNKLLQFFKIAKKYMVENVDFKPLLTYQQKKLERFKLTEKQMPTFQLLVSKVLRFAEKEGISTNLQNFIEPTLFLEGDDIIKIRKRFMNFSNNKKKKIPCFKPWYFMKVYPEFGTVGPCLVPNELHMEELNKGSLKEKWYGKKFQRLRNMLMDYKLPEFCKSCCGGAIFDDMRIKPRLKI
jgi:MoaA/NifB/PqqE/SkfB family radical SAM enzyme